MPIDAKAVKKVAHLARLAISENDIAPLTKDLDNILMLIEKMNQTDTKNVEPLAHPFDATQPLREDTVSEENKRELMQSTAPQVKAGFYIVPQFIETE